MRVSINTRQAYSEVDEFLDLISEAKKNKVPKNIRDIFKREKDTKYTKGIIMGADIKDQQLKEETLAIIAWLNLQYWCDDENEKKRLKTIYSQNEKLYNELFKLEFDPVFMFNKENDSNFHMIPLNEKSDKESLMNKIIKIVKKLFNK